MALEQDSREIAFFIKHLPGRHNQLTHGRRFGNASLSSPVDHLSQKDRSDKLVEDYADWLNKNISPDEKTGIQKYTGNAFSEMNKALRTGTTSIYEKEIRNATTGLEKGRAPYNFTTTRKMGHFDGIDNYWKMLQENKGKTFVDPAFTSTTSNDKNVFGSSIKFYIHVPKGASGGYVKMISQFKNENEFLLPPKTRFKVLKTEVVGGVRTVHVGIPNR